MTFVFYKAFSLNCSNISPSLGRNRQFVWVRYRTICGGLYIGRVNWFDINVFLRVFKVVTSELISPKILLLYNYIYNTLPIDIPVVYYLGTQKLQCLDSIIRIGSFTLDIISI